MRSAEVSYWTWAADGSNDVLVRGDLEQIGKDVAGGRSDPGVFVDAGLRRACEAGGADRRRLARVLTAFVSMALSLCARARHLAAPMRSTVFILHSHLIIFRVAMGTVVPVCL